MRSKITKISSVMAILLVMLSCMPAVFAADDELTINDSAAVKAGDTVTYTMYLADCDEPIIGMQMYLFFDSDYLEYVDDSLNYEKFDGVVHNTSLEGYIPIMWTNISNAADFSNKAVFLTLDFKVLKGGECAISEFITELYGDDMTYVKNYTFTYDLSVNGDKLVAGSPVVVNTDDSIVSQYQGGFINYDDGMGDNSPENGAHVAIVGSQVVTEIKEATRYESAGGSGGSNTTTILIIVGAVIVVLAIVAIVIVKKRDDAKNKSENVKDDGELSE